MDFPTALVLAEGMNMPFTDYRQAREEEAKALAASKCGAGPSWRLSRTKIKDWEADVVNIFGFWLFREDAITFATSILHDWGALEDAITQPGWLNVDPVSLEEAIQELDCHHPDAMALVAAEEDEQAESEALARSFRT